MSFAEKIYIELYMPDATSPYFKVSYEPENGWVHSDWIGFIDKEKYFNAYEALIGALQKAKVKKWLNDNQRQVGPWFRHDNVMADEWKHDFKNAGIEIIAQILSPSEFTRQSALRFEQDMKSLYRFQSFDTESEAIDWLKKCN